MAASHTRVGERYLYCEGDVPLLFTENETNNERLFGTPNASPYVKDGINDYVVHGQQEAVNPAHTGTKAAAHYQVNVGAGQTATIRLRLSDQSPLQPWASPSRVSLPSCKRASARRMSSIAPSRRHGSATDEARVMRQALAGMLWSKQYFGFDVDKWLEEHGVDPLRPRQPADAEQRMVPHGQRPCHLDAGQVGVSLVCRVGPGVSHHRALDGRCGFRERPARPDAAGASSCIRPVRSRRTNGTSATSIRPCTPGPRSFCTGRNRRSRAKATWNFSGGLLQS